MLNADNKQLTENLIREMAINNRIFILWKKRATFKN